MPESFFLLIAFVFFEERDPSGNRKQMTYFRMEWPAIRKERQIGHSFKKSNFVEWSVHEIITLYFDVFSLCLRCILMHLQSIYEAPAFLLSVAGF